jgi:hypothetical protein
MVSLFAKQTITLCNYIAEIGKEFREELKIENLMGKK